MTEEIPQREEIPADVAQPAPPSRQQIYDSIHHEDTPQVVKRYLKAQLYGESGGRREMRQALEQTPKPDIGEATIRRSPKPRKPAHLSGRQFRKLRKQAQKIVRSAH